MRKEIIIKSSIQVLNELLVIQIKHSIIVKHSMIFLTITIGRNKKHKKMEIRSSLQQFYTD